MFEYNASTGKESQISSFPSSLVDPNEKTLFNSNGNMIGAINGGNSLGQVVGYEFDGKSNYGFIQDANGTQHVLGVLPGFQYSLPSSIDNAGDVVGDASNSGTRGLGFLYKDGVMYNLSDLVPGAFQDLHLYMPKINAAGQIVATTIDFGNSQTYLLTLDAQSPNVPEPTTWMVLGSGLLGLGFRRFRKSVTVV